MKSDVDALKETVFGNGKPGLLSDVRLLTVRVQTVEQKQEAQGTNLEKILRGVWIAIGILIARSGVDVAKLFHLLP